jgi:hypothetical protein
VTAPPFPPFPTKPLPVPIRMWFGSNGSTARPGMLRPPAIASEPGTSDQLLPPSVDLYRPTPASLSPLPFASPVPT